MSAEKKKNKKAISIVIAVLAAAVLVISLFYLMNREDSLTEAEREATVHGTEPMLTAEENAIPGEALAITEVGNYTGFYMEDGTDEPVTGILNVVVANVSKEPVQYAEVSMDVNGETAYFTVTALPAGESAVLLERNRMEYRDDVDYMRAEFEISNVALFDKELSLHEDKLKIQTLDGALNITNVSGADITDTIILCYKSYQNDMYYGGIAYRIKLEGGLKAGELRQIMVEHFQEPGSRMVFVDFVAA